MANLLLGKPVIDGLKADLTERVSRLRAAGTQPTLAILRVGERPDDLSYERTALKRAEGLGIRVQQVVLPELTVNVEPFDPYDESKVDLTGIVNARTQ